MALIIKNGEILLGHRHYEDISIWTCPGGRSDDNETIETTLRREVREEIGVSDFLIKEYLGEFVGINIEDKVFSFLCEIHQKEILVEPEKFSEWKWFNKDEVKELAMSKNMKGLIIAILSKKFQGRLINHREGAQ